MSDKTTAALAAEQADAEATTTQEAELLPAATLDELEQVDLGTVAEGERAPFRITDDRCADWAIRKIADERSEYDRLKALADEQIAAINEKVAAARKRMENGTSYLTSCLADFFATVPHKETKTTEKYRLLSGTLTFKKGTTKTKLDETKLVPWLKANGYFATDEIAVLQAGAYSVEVPTSAVSNGTKFNGYAAGAITTLVDLIPYIESVTNLTETAGGDDGEPYTTEGDNRLRERIRLAPAKRSTAGPEQAYIYWVMTADSSIVDAKAVSEKETVSETLTVYDGKAFKGGGTLLTDTLVVKAHGQSTAAVKDTDYTVDYADGLLAITLKGSLAAAESIDIIITRTLEGCVKIVPLLEGGGIPDAAMLAKVLDVVNAKDIRPLTDKVSAVPPEVETYDIEIVYYTTPESEAEVIANVEGTGGAIDRYNEWQVAALGRDINPDQLRKRILSPSWGENLTGAFRVDVVKPTYKALDDTQVAKFSGHLTVSHKVESEVV